MVSLHGGNCVPPWRESSLTMAEMFSHHGGKLHILLYLEMNSLCKGARIPIIKGIAHLYKEEGSMLGRATRTPAITRLPIIKRDETSKTKRGYAMLGMQTAYPLP